MMRRILGSLCVMQHMYRTAHHRETT
jgi:hypothetical protein